MAVISLFLKTTAGLHPTPIERRRPKGLRASCAVILKSCMIDIVLHHHTYLVPPAKHYPSVCPIPLPAAHFQLSSSHHHGGAAHTSSGHSMATKGEPLTGFGIADLTFTMASKGEPLTGFICRAHNNAASFHFVCKPHEACKIRGSV